MDPSAFVITRAGPGQGTRAISRCPRERADFVKIGECLEVRDQVTEPRRARSDDRVGERVELLVHEIVEVQRVTSRAVDQRCCLRRGALAAANHGRGPTLLGELSAKDFSQRLGAPGEGAAWHAAQLTRASARASSRAAAELGIGFASDTASSTDMCGVEPSPAQPPRAALRAAAAGGGAMVGSASPERRRRDRSSAHMPSPIEPPPPGARGETSLTWCPSRRRRRLQSASGRPLLAYRCA